MRAFYWLGRHGSGTVLRAVTVVLAVFACLLEGQGARADTEPLRVQLLWHHQAQFAGIYVAEAKGYYERAGLEVELVEGGPATNPLENLGRGDIDVALAWLPVAMQTRLRWDVVNVGQIFRESGSALVCRRDAGIRRLEDIAGKTIGVWYIGDEVNLRHWLGTVGVDPSTVRLRAQFPDARDLIAGRVDCAMAMMYNEYWTILDSHLSPSDLLVVRFDENGLGFLEDGIYATQGSLADPDKRAAIAAFVKGTAEGWAYAAGNVDEAFAITMARVPAADAAHQRRMFTSILGMVGDAEYLGLLDISAFDHSVGMLADQQGTEVIGRLAEGAWTHRIWYEAGLGQESLLTLTQATRHHLAETVATGWFTTLLLSGSAVFGFAGFMRAQQRNYDWWGAFVLTLLPAAGGGTIRDLLVGGDRYPPFIVQDPAYLQVVLGTFLAGIVSTAFMSERVVESKAFTAAMKVFDTLGFAAVTVIGAKVAMMAELSWLWIPICCGLTAAGGGMLSDVISGNEPRTFRGEPYEEIAILGGLFMFMGLQVADAYEHQTWITPAVIVATLVVTFLMRGAVIVFGIRVPTFGRPVSRETSAAAG